MNLHGGIGRPEPLPRRGGVAIGAKVSLSPTLFGQDQKRELDQLALCLRHVVAIILVRAIPLCDELFPLRILDVPSHVLIQCFAVGVVKLQIFVELFHSDITR